MPPSDKEQLGRDILARCVTRDRPLKKGECVLHLSARNVAFVLDMDKNPLKSELEDDGKRCDFAAYQRRNPLNGRECLVLMEFKQKLHNVNEPLKQLGDSLEFLGSLSGHPEFAFDSHASVLVCADEVGPRKTRQLMDRKVICGGASVRLRPLILMSGGKLTSEQIAKFERPSPKFVKSRRKG